MSTAWRVGEAADGERVDLFLAREAKLSRSRLKSLFEDGAVKVDGRRVPKGALLKQGQEVALTLPEPPAATVPPQPELPLEVLFEDAQLVAVSKPAGAPCHPLQPGETGTVANALVARYPTCAQAGADPREAGLCHRLDTETSGVLLAAKDRASWDAVRGAFQAHTVTKRYVALVSGPIDDAGELSLRLAHRGDHVVPAPFDDDARDAESSFRVTRRKGEWSLVEVDIVTGVLHQVRAHLAAIGAPIAGDVLYGGQSVEGLSRFFLHAALLALPHPATGQRLTLECPLPADLAAVRDRLL